MGKLKFPADRRLRIAGLEHRLLVRIVYISIERWESKLNKSMQSCYQTSRNKVKKKSEKIISFHI